MYKTTMTITRIVGATILVFAGYVFFSALPDLRRYIKISRM
jgi:hypothetical protein